MYVTLKQYVGKVDGLSELENDTVMGNAVIPR